MAAVPVISFGSDSWQYARLSEAVLGQLAVDLTAAIVAFLAHERDRQFIAARSTRISLVIVGGLHQQLSPFVVGQSRRQGLGCLAGAASRTKPQAQDSNPAVASPPYGKRCTTG